jgi:DNA repair photolyase
LDALKCLSDAGIPTWAFIGPLVPGFVDEERLAGILTRVKEAGASKVLVDKLRLKPGLWQRMEPAMEEKRYVLDACRKALFADPGFFNDLREQTRLVCKDLKLECELNF